LKPVHQRLGPAWITFSSLFDDGVEKTPRNLRHFPVLVERWHPVSSMVTPDQVNLVRVCFLRIIINFSIRPQMACQSLAIGKTGVIIRLYPWQTSNPVVQELKIPETAALPKKATAGSSQGWELTGGITMDPFTCASGELFINTNLQRLELAATAGIVDMNTYGIETAAKAWRVPCLHLRVISDLANESAKEDFLKFEKTWAGDLGVAACQVVQNLKPDPTHPRSYDALRKLLPQPGQPQPAPVPSQGGSPK
jgi:hypothetical protein